MPDIEATTTCGCHVVLKGEASEAHSIVFCPMHAAAPRLLTALEDLLPWMERGRERFDREQARVLTQAIAAIRDATGQS